MDYQGDFDQSLYIEAWQLASLRYPILRTSFDWEKEIVQIVHEGISINEDNFAYEDLRHLATEEQDGAINTIQKARPQHRL